MNLNTRKTSSRLGNNEFKLAIVKQEEAYRKQRVVVDIVAILVKKMK